MNDVCSNYEYLKLLSKSYPSISAAATEIINLQAILNLPKGTEHFLSDLHGENEAFLHILKNASGVIKTKINEIFSTTMTEAERRLLATLIYYPEDKLEIIKKNTDDIEDWYRVTLYHLIELCRNVSSKYTRSKVRKALPKDFEYIIDELIHTNDLSHNKHEYYDQIIRTIIKTGRADAFIIALSKLIQRLTIDHLHILGDIFDRGPRADIIMDELLKYHSVDIQWGNHDIVWMGAASGSEACIANVIRNSLKYNNFDVLEDGYGISTRPLITFAMEAYGNDDCRLFMPEISGELKNENSDFMAAKIHKAITVIQFKLEAQIIKRHPEYRMESRIFIDKIDYETGTVVIDGKEYALLDKNFPTIDKNNPFALTRQEEEVINHLKRSFMHSQKLQEHVKFLFSKGNMYKVYNGNLLYHGCVPMDENGDFTEVDFFGESLSGKAYIEKAEKLARRGFLGLGDEKRDGLDFMWYLWCGSKSPLFGKSKMATFERYFIADKELHHEEKDNYYKLVDKKEICDKILAEFGVCGERSHIINGHVPVQIKNGESPVRADGKLLVIDGGLSKAYQAKTGIAGYTLIYNSYGLILAEHEPFESTAAAIQEERDMHSKSVMLESVRKRTLVMDTDTGARIKKEIGELELLLDAYRSGLMTE